MLLGDRFEQFLDRHHKIERVIVTSVAIACCGCIAYLWGVL